MNTKPSLSAERRPVSWPAALVYRAWKMWVARALVVLFVLTLAFGLGWWLAPVGGGAPAEPAATGAAAAVAEVWTCSMHPQIKLPQPGQCPICFMDLIPVQSGAQNGELPQLSLNERARVLARVETTEVQQRELTLELNLVGKVAADETRITYVSSYIPGRIDRLFVNYTGIFAGAGEHLAEIYSPELLVAQREYIVALEGAERLPAPVQGSLGRQGAAAMIEAARRKLELWGVPADEISRLERERRPNDHIRIDAPSSGWVLERMAYEGMYVETGTRLFTLGDLRTVWVFLDAYELDLPFLRYGQRVTFETEAYPGREFEGRISYIDPQLTDVTRTVKVRVNVVNDDMQLRPGMFVRASVRVRIGEGGEVIEPAMAGKFICPMHPEVIKDHAGQCDVCGMDLLSAEALGLVAREPPGERALAIPRTAVLLTGRRAVVYVETETEAGEVVYEGRQVELGPRAGDWWVVQSGLSEGERVVVRGAFQIDSALQIQARPSMMQPADDGATSQPAGHEHLAHDAALAGIESRAVAGAPYHAQMRPVLEALVELTESLSGDNAETAPAALARLREAVGRVEPTGLEGTDAELFTEQVAAMRATLPALEAKSLSELRSALPAVHAAVERYLRTFGHDRDQPFVRLFCPMAFDNRGASWLQVDDQVRNPYFGSRMYRCGEKRGAIAADGTEVR